MKLYYFDCYALGEDIRMILHHANVNFEDIRFTYDPPRQEFEDLKKTGIFEFG